MQRDHPPARRLAGHGQAPPVARSQFALAAIADGGQIGHLLGMGLAHVGRVYDDQRVLPDPRRRVRGDLLVDRLRQPGRIQVPAQPLLGLLRQDVLVEGAGDGTELHVLPRLHPEHHLPDELEARPGKAGRKYPQKSLQLFSHAMRNQDTVHLGLPVRCCNLHDARRIVARRGHFHLSGVAFSIPPTTCAKSPLKTGDCPVIWRQDYPQFFRLPGRAKPIAPHRRGLASVWTEASSGPDGRTGWRCRKPRRSSGSPGRRRTAWRSGRCGWSARPA